MSEQRFKICGDQIPELIGRTALYESLVADVTKTTPSHKAILGSRYSGKTVLLNALIHNASVKKRFSNIIVWDLGHQTPTSDSEFFHQLANRVGEEYPDYKEFFKQTKNLYQTLREVFDDLRINGKTILMLWDGFDVPLTIGALSRNLWDQLRELATTPSLYLVVATRKPMLELLRNDEAAPSEFWNLFEQPPVCLSSMDEKDLDALLSNLPECEFDGPARKELMNWSGGNFVLMMGLLNAITLSKSAGAIHKDEVVSSAESALEIIGCHLDQIWRDCPVESQDLWHSLCERDMSETQAAGCARNSLKHNGFSTQSGSRIKASCNLLKMHIKNIGHENGTMPRLFSKEQDYLDNIKAVLMYRRKQLHASEQIKLLITKIDRAISDIPESPELCLESMRSILDTVVAMILDKELNNSRCIPQEWLAEWSDKGLSDWQNGANVPRERGRQMFFLQLMTGDRSGYDRKSQFVNQEISAMVNSLHQLANYGQHPDTIILGTAVSATMQSIELAHLLEKQLS